MIFRTARHTDNLENVTKFYVEILGLEKLGEFNNHDGYDGVFLGRNDCSWHLEFTKSEAKAEHQFDDDDILVFYPTSDEEYQKILAQISERKITIHQPKNPYWKENGILIKDPDGYHIVISPLKIDK